MQFQYSPYLPAYYATMLRVDHSSGNLTWDSAKGQTVLVVQAPYGQRPLQQMEEICARMSEIDLAEDDYTEVLPQVWVRLVTAVQKVRNSGCPMRGLASSYSIFCCHQQEAGPTLVHAPQHPQNAAVDIPAEMSFSLRPETRLVKSGPFGLGKAKEVETGFFVVTFLSPCPPGYADGDIFFPLDHLRIPVTRAMLEQKTVFFRTPVPPVPVTQNQGLKLIQC